MRTTGFLFVAVLLLTAAPQNAQTQLSAAIDMRTAAEAGLFAPAKGDRLVLRGVFNGWEGDAYRLSDPDGDGIWTGSWPLAEPVPGPLEFKSVIVRGDGRIIWEERPNPANPPYGNRIAAPDPAPTPFDLSPYLIDAAHRFTPAQLREDFDGFRRTIENLHPALYAVTPKPVFDRRLDAAAAALDHPMDVTEFRRHLAPLMAAIGCGHSSLWMPPPWWQAVPERWFPLAVAVTDEGLYTIRHLSDSLAVSPGRRITAINGISAAVLRDTLLSGISGDGGNCAYRTDVLERRFADYLALHLGFPERFRITMEATGSAPSSTLDLAPVPRAAVEAARTVPPRRSLEILPDAAVLTLNHFNYYHDRDNFTAFLAESFAAIKASGASALILDLRDNNGGDPYSAAELLRYLIARPTPYWAEPYPHMEALAEPLPPTADRFAGTVLTLINGRCFSTTGHLLALLRHHGIGKFVGTESGGTFQCHDAKIQVPLPNTGLILQVAQRRFAVAVAPMPIERGIRPDRTVRPTPADRAAGRDTVREAALALVRTGDGGEAP